ncbi:MAG: 2-oxoglutarate dehydrogenase E1 component [Geobacteraceae bacterium]|nr:2-oxoglutarate dehydrogenase E1 component [Geobacteraceae bacterium]
MSFLDSVSPQWIEGHYLLWKKAPHLVAAEWAAFFSGFEMGSTASTAETATPSPETARKLAAVQSLIHRHRDMGHLLACTDPLSPCKREHPLLSLQAFGLEKADLDRVFPTEDFTTAEATLREILRILRDTYCRSIGVEFMHIQDPRQWQWLVDRMEKSGNRQVFSLDDKRAILKRLLEASLFEIFLHRKFPGQTRFSLEGGETIIPLLDAVVSRAGRQGVTDVILGMPHRGRLNIQAHIFGKKYENIFAEFRDTEDPGFVGDGDVKYHRGISADVHREGDATIHLTLVPNPSHLEAVNPVVEGKSRARQDRYGADGASRVLPVLIHGDAAFAGQGIVAETLNMSQLEGYATGGTLHIVLNNQIGFTTRPADARSTRYATDVAKMLAAPIFHVHCEDPEAAIHAAHLALDFRQKFAVDVVVELICYRRHGHNEGDEPYFTEPLMYDQISNRPPAHQLYGERLLQEGLSSEEIDGLKDAVSKTLESAFNGSPTAAEAPFLGRWSAFCQESAATKIETGVPAPLLLSLTEAMVVLPAGFTPHPKIAALYAKRRDCVATGAGIDWANAESLAFAALLHEGISVRLSGEDSRRGTFSQRHCVLHDMRSGRSRIPLDTVAADTAAFRPYDSLLSEAAVLGFEYGYALEFPEGLTIWEAQYGDFANGAQVIIDQFLCSGETKWGRASGLVLLLPHGYEGQGAEHSSARLERFLQLCADGNLQVAFPSTPAQYFHLLRRQAKQPFRKPLVILTPKSLLRNPACISRLDELAGGWFREILPSSADPEKVTALLVCSGKLYYELAKKRLLTNREDTAIIRIEQLYPLRADLLREELGRFRHARNCTWVQEEPRNMGAWNYIRPHLAGILGIEPKYAGRKEAASPATGSFRQHRAEQERLLEEAFG